MAFNERNISGNMGTYPGVGNPAAHSSAVDPSKVSHVLVAFPRIGRAW